jgi:cytidylate kinase
MAVITISRQFGAGGRTLGRMIADKLQYTFADNEVIQMIAEAANVSPMWVESVEKEAGTRLSRAINRLVTRNLVDKVLKDERGYIDEKIYLDYLVVIISQIGEEGDVVILGRGSQYILNDHPDAFHILLIDDYENRVQFMMKHYDLPRNKAESVVRAEDRRRLSLYRRIGKEDYDNPELYHLVLNMSRMDLDTALRIVFGMVGKR